MCALTATAFLALLGLSRRAPAGEATLLRIGGTGMALATMRQIGAEFVATQPDVAIKVLPSLGTGGGLAAVADAAIGIALSARALNDAERAKGLRSLAYARTPIAFVSSHRGYAGHHPVAGRCDIDGKHACLAGRHANPPGSAGSFRC